MLEIFTMTADGKEKKQLTKGQNYNTSPVFSPGGKKILFLSAPNRDDNWGMYEMNIDGTGLHQIPIELDEVPK